MSPCFLLQILMIHTLASLGRERCANQTVWPWGVQQVIFGCLLPPQCNWGVPDPLSLLLLPPNFWGYRCMLACPAYMALQGKPRVLCTLGEPSAN